jgi:hypothetical protein
MQTIIRCIFLEFNKTNLNMFRVSLCPSSGEQEQDWLKLHVKMPGCAGRGCVEQWCRQCAVLTSLVLVLLMMGIMMPETS